MTLDLPFVLAAIAALVVGMSKGGLPAIGMLGVPMLSLVMSPVQAAVLLLPIYIASDAVGVWLYRRQFSTPNLRILIPGGLAGIGLAWGTASMISDRALGALIGLIGVAFCLNAWLRRGPQGPGQPPRVAPGLFWGGLAGFTSFISHSGAPPYQVYMLPQKLDKQVFAGTTTIFFAVVNLAKLGPYQMLRPYTGEGLHFALTLLPFALTGTFIGAWLTKRLNDRWFYTLVQISLFGVSIKLLWDALLKP